MKITGWTKAKMMDIVDAKYSDNTGILVGGDGSSHRKLEHICTDEMHRWCWENGDCEKPGRPRCHRISIEIKATPCSA